jgi:hypothetical protein
MNYLFIFFDHCKLSFFKYDLRVSFFVQTENQKDKKKLRQKGYDDDCKNGEYSHFE